MIDAYFQVLLTDVGLVGLCGCYYERTIDTENLR